MSILNHTTIRFLSTLIIVPALVTLFAAQVESHKLSWVVHGVFAFLLTLLIFGAFLRAKHAILYFLFFVALASVWEFFEFFVIGQRVENSLILTAVDTFMDMLFGVTGAGIGMLLAILVKKHSTWLT